MQISNFPTQGFYKVRTASGQIGWVETGSVGSELLPAAPSSPEFDLPAPPAETPSATTTTVVPYEDTKSSEKPRVSVDEPKEPPTTPRDPWEFKLFGGILKVSLSDVNNQLGATLFNVMPYYGGQAGYPLNSDLYVLFRVDRINSTTTAGGASFNLSSTPIMTGLEYTFARSHSVFVQGSLLLGIAIATTLDMTATSLPQPNLTELQATSFTEMVQIDAGVDLSRMFALFVEGGYRFLKSESVGPSIIGNGGTVFQTNGQNVSIPLDLSGPFVGGGLFDPALKLVSSYFFSLTFFGGPPVLLLPLALHG